MARRPVGPWWGLWLIFLDEVFGKQAALLLAVLINVLANVPIRIFLLRHGDYLAGRKAQIVLMRGAVIVDGLDLEVRHLGGKSAKGQAITRATTDEVQRSKARKCKQKQ
jgi:hypothetical protein